MPSPMLDDLAALKAKQVERDHRCAVTSDAVVSGMQQYEISVHQRAIDCYVGGRRVRYFGGKRLHSSKTISKIRVMLHEGRVKIAIDCGRILLAKDIDQDLASVGSQNALARCRLSRAR